MKEFGKTVLVSATLTLFVYVFLTILINLTS